MILTYVWSDRRRLVYPLLFSIGALYGWLVLHESGTFVKFTQAGADLFA